MPILRSLHLRKLLQLTLVAVFFAACATRLNAQSRGELLYEYHCVACHSERIHWRDRGIVTSWESLKYQVDRWQAYSVLHWTQADINEVSKYLNDEIYRFPQTTDELTLQQSPYPRRP